MQYTMLGQTGLQVSRLCFGTMSFGGDADKETSAQMFHRCREVGINFFDCANIYSRGAAEEILGQLIQPCRDELIITSKVGGAMDDNDPGKGLAGPNIIAQVENSLRRLQIDHLDIYFCHIFDPQAPMDQTLRALDQLVQQGKIRHVGISNWAAWQIAKAQGICQKEALAPIAVIQPMYNLVKRTAEIEILPMAQSEKLGVIPYGPVAGGLLSGKYSAALKPTEARLFSNKLYSLRYRDKAYHEITARFCDYARKIAVHPVTLAVAWAAAHPAVTAPIIGARNLEQLEASLAAADYQMSPHQRQEISDLTPPVPIATDRREEQFQADQP